MWRVPNMHLIDCKQLLFIIIIYSLTEVGGRNRVHAKRINHNVWFCCCSQECIDQNAGTGQRAIGQRAFVFCTRMWMKNQRKYIPAPFVAFDWNPSCQGHLHRWNSINCTTILHREGSVPAHGFPNLVHWPCDRVVWHCIWSARRRTHATNHRP